MNHINHEKLAAMIDEARSQHPEETLPELIFRAYHRYDALNPQPSFWRRLWLLLIGGALLLVALAAGAQTGSVNLDRIGQVKVSGDDIIDTTNHAVRTNCVVGCSASGGGGAAQLQVRNAGDTAWVNVGFNVANLTLPVTLQTGAATIGAISNTSFAATQSGTWNVGTLTSITNPVAVTGTFWQSTQPVSLSSLPALTAGSAVIGHVIADSASTTAVTGNVAVTNAGLSNLDVLLSTRTKPADQQHAIIDSGSTVVTQGTGANLHVNVDSAPTTAVTGTFFQATQPVSGTVAATQSGTWTVQPGNTANTTPWLATARIVGNTGATLDAAPAAALPTNAQVIAGRDSSQTGGGVEVPVICDKSAVITATAAATVIVIPLTASKTTYICGFVITGAGAAGTMQWKSGTGTTCGTGSANLTGAMATAIGGTVSYGTGFGTIMRHASAAQDTCITMATASATAAGVVSYAQF